MEKFAKVIDHPDLKRDIHSKAILNADSTGLNKYKEERDKQLKINKVLSETEALKSDMDEIKALLKELLGRK